MKLSRAEIASRQIEDLSRFKAKKLHNLRIEYALHALKNADNFLEVGSGDGFCTRSIVSWSKKKFKHVAGFDIDEARVKNALRFWNADGVIQYRAHDAQKPFPFSDGQFDAVVLLDILEHVDKPEKLAAECYRVLKKGGVLFLCVPCEGEPVTLHRYLYQMKWDGTTKYAGHVQQFTKKEAQAIFMKVGFRKKWVRYSCHWFGQLTDAAGYEIKRFFDEERTKPLRGARKLFFYLLKKSVKTFMQKISYFESKLFARVGIGAMDLNVVFEK